MTLRREHLPPVAFVCMMMGLCAGLLSFRLGYLQLALQDEPFTLLFTRADWDMLLGPLWDADTHRPVHYALQKAWNGVAGESRAAVRWLSVLLSALCVPFVYVIACHAHSHRAAQFAVTCLVFAPQFVFHARKARMYPLLTLCLLVVFWCVLKLVDKYRPSPSQQSQRRAVLWGVVVCVAALAFYVHSLALFVPVVIGMTIIVMVLVGLLGARILWHLGLAWLVYLVLILPGVFPILTHAGTTMQDFWLPVPTLDYTYRQFVSVYPYPPWAKPIVGLLLLAALWVLRARPLELGILLSGVAGFPVLLWAISYIQPILLASGIAWTGALGAVLIGCALAALPRLWAAALVGLILFGQFVANQEEYPAMPQVAWTDQFDPLLVDFDPARDLMVLGFQQIEARLRWSHPQIFDGRVMAFSYRDRQDVFHEVYRSEFVLRAAADAIPRPAGRLWVLKEASQRFKISDDDNVTEALNVVVKGLERVELHEFDGIQLEIYASSSSG